jgi:hypothetical protein
VVLAKHLSVRQAERWVREYQPSRAMPNQTEAPASRAMAPVVEQLKDRFGDAVRVTGSRRRGSVTIKYRSTDELDDLLAFLLR